MASIETSLHWIYAAIMFLSAFIFFLMGRNPRGIPYYKYIIHMFIVSWSGLAYAAMAMQQGSVEVNGEQVYYARYIDWTITTPLLLLSLALTGKLVTRKEGWLIAGMMGTQAIMILTGLVADLSPKGAVQSFWYIVGCVCLLIVFYLIWGPLKTIAQTQGPNLGHVYRKSALFLSIQWILYPLVWMLGTPGLGVLDKMGTTVFFIILPIVSKVGFGFFNLVKLRNLPETDKPAPEPPHPHQPAARDQHLSSKR